MGCEGLRGGLETVAVVLGVVGFGLGWAAWAGEPYPLLPMSGREDPSPPAGPDPEPSMGEPSLWLVDGFNVLHASLLGGQERAEWWTETRRAEVLELAESLARGGSEAGVEVWVAFDGPEAPDGPDGPGSACRREGPGPHAVFAPSADDWLVRQVKASPDPGAVAVVTADRKVAARARHCGARVVSPRAFAQACRGREAGS